MLSAGTFARIRWSNADLERAPSVIAVKAGNGDTVMIVK